MNMQIEVKPDLEAALVRRAREDDLPLERAAEIVLEQSLLRAGVQFMDPPADNGLQQAKQFQDLVEGRSSEMPEYLSNCKLPVAGGKSSISELLRFFEDNAVSVPVAPNVTYSREEIYRDHD